jgi:LAO/AO transport system kinase
MWQQLLEQLIHGDIKALARSISFVENEQEGYEDMLSQLPRTAAKIIGITGPPGAGKSTFTDGLIRLMVEKRQKIAVLCVDPSSPFHLGALLGDRIRMSEWYTHESVFIRSLATRGSMGGLNPKTIEITELAAAAGYDYIIVETVGVGQSEIEIAGLADVTVVVLVPEAGDEVQTMKAGLMEIADIFIVNKADRPGADEFVKNLRLMLSPTFSTHQNEVQIIKTIASRMEGIDNAFAAIKNHLGANIQNEKRAWLLAEKAWMLIQQARMKGITKRQLADAIREIPTADFNLYRFARGISHNTISEAHP